MALRAGWPGGRPPPAGPQAAPASPKAAGPKAYRAIGGSFKGKARNLPVLKIGLLGFCLAPWVHLDLVRLMLKLIAFSCLDVGNIGCLSSDRAMLIIRLDLRLMSYI